MTLDPGILETLGWLILITGGVASLLAMTCLALEAISKSDWCRRRQHQRNLDRRLKDYMRSGRTRMW